MAHGCSLLKFLLTMFCVIQYIDCGQHCEARDFRDVVMSVRELRTDFQKLKNQIAEEIRDLKNTFYEEIEEIRKSVTPSTKETTTIPTTMPTTTISTPTTSTPTPSTTTEAVTTTATPVTPSTKETTTLPTTMPTTTISTPTTSTPTPSTTTEAVTTKTTPVTANDCKDIMERGGSPTSGIYNIRLPQSGNDIPVYCDMATDGGGWTVFQYRFNGLTDFYRSMSEYVTGFGDLGEEFWLGLKHIQELSTYCPTVDLRLDLVKSDGTSGYETFSNFSLSPAPAYTLHINPGTGTLGDRDGLSYNNGYNFYTFDHDTSNGCAVLYHGAWWYNNCAWANLNGEYLHPPGGVSSYNGGEGGMTYREFDGVKSLKSSKMMMRRNTSRKC